MKKEKRADRLKRLVDEFRANMEKEHPLLTAEEKDDYAMAYCNLLIGEEMDEFHIRERALKIKPLARILKKEYRSSKEDLSFSDELAKENADTMLVWCTPFELQLCYVERFARRMILREGKRPVSTEGLFEVARFTCYHTHRGSFDYFSPTPVDVLQQIPLDVDVSKICAFELHQPKACFDSVMNRYKAMIILYGSENGLPQICREQAVILNGKFF